MGTLRISSTCAIATAELSRVVVGRGCPMLFRLFESVLKFNEPSRILLTTRNHGLKAETQMMKGSDRNSVMVSDTLGGVLLTATTASWMVDHERASWFSSRVSL